MKRNKNEASKITLYAIGGGMEQNQLIAQYLQSESHYTLRSSVNSGQEGLEECRMNLPDVVLIDRSVTDIDSIEIVKQLTIPSPKIRMAEKS